MSFRRRTRTPRSKKKVLKPKGKQETKAVAKPAAKKRGSPTDGLGWQLRAKRDRRIAQVNRALLDAQQAEDFFSSEDGIRELDVSTVESALAAVISILDGDYFTELGVEQGVMTEAAQEHEEKLTKGKEKLEVIEKVITLHQGEDGKKKKKKKGKAKEELDDDCVEQVDTSSEVLMFVCQDAEELNIHTPDGLYKY